MGKIARPRGLPAARRAVISLMAVSGYFAEKAFHDPQPAHSSTYLPLLATIHCAPTLVRSPWCLRSLSLLIQIAKNAAMFAEIEVTATSLLLKLDTQPVKLLSPQDLASGALQALHGVTELELKIQDNSGTYVSLCFRTPGNQRRRQLHSPYSGT